MSKWITSTHGVSILTRHLRKNRDRNDSLASVN